MQTKIGNHKYRQRNKRINIKKKYKQTKKYIDKEATSKELRKEKDERNNEKREREKERKRLRETIFKIARQHYVQKEINKTIHKPFKHFFLSLVIWSYSTKHH